MTYNSLAFLFFFAIFISVYLLMPSVRMRQAVILLGSLTFYCLAGSPLLLLLVVLGTLVVYACSRRMESIYAGFEQEKQGMTPKEAAVLFASYKKRSRKYLMAALIALLGFLIFVKVAKLVQLPGILVPVGISYYTFSSVGYLLDIYWKKTKAEHNFAMLLLCVIFFPHIVLGPISRYPRLLGQMKELPGFDYTRVCFGLQRMLWGFFKKMVVADRIARYTTVVFDSPQSYVGVEIVLAIFLCAIELYADFSGCMDIVCGASQTMGVTLDENFKHPFFATSAAEFWRRWHITLGTWFKDYVYMPIAMNPWFMKMVGKLRKKYGNKAGQVVSSAVPLGIVWLLTGLWHGTGMNYVVWGIYWGVLIILETAFPVKKSKEQKQNLFRLLRMLRTFLLFCIGRMLTVTGTISGFFVLLRRIFAASGLHAFTSGSIFTYGLDLPNFVVVAIGILLIWIVDILQERLQLRVRIAAFPLPVRWLIYYGACVILLIFAGYGSAYDATSFIYGAF